MSKRKSPRYWTPENIDNAFNSLRRELGRTPTVKEFTERFGGGINFIKRGAYNQTVNTWNGYLRLRSIKPKHDIGKWTPEKVDEEFDSLREELGRIPTYIEFQDRRGGVFGAISTGRYDPEIKTYNQYLVRRGFEPTHENNKWTPELIDQAFDSLRQKLGRIPKQKELTALGIHIIYSGGYDPNIRNYSQYLESRGLKPVNRQKYWTPKRIDEAFDSLREELGRLPISEEFRKKCGGAFTKIKNGGYDPKILTYNEYIRSRGLRPNIENWTRERIDVAFDTLKEELGRTPQAQEFAKRFGGAISAIANRLYDPEIRTYVQYVKSRRFEPIRERGQWTTQRVDDVFDALLEELGRIPTAKEFKNRASGALGAIFQGRYSTDFKTYRAYLKFRGLKPRFRKWVPEEVDHVFYSLMERLGRVPTSEEFTKEGGGALQIIREGKYSPQIRSWNDYIKQKGLEPVVKREKWTPERVDEVFDTFIEKLGMIPTYDEFQEKYGSALVAITQGRYDPTILRWNQYIMHRRLDIEQFLTEQIQETVTAYLAE